jgi:hypothetical protein
MLRVVVLTTACLIPVVCVGAEPRSGPAAAVAVHGDATIRGPALGSEIVIRTTSRLAGAIDSLTWNGREFIDSFDHGRQLQSAASFDCSRDGEFWAERYNPTEAGSRRDGAGATSTSRLLSIRAEGAELRTTVQPAFWLTPEEASSGRPALNNRTLSDHRIAKHVRIGYEKLANIVDYHVTFTVPAGERHRFGQFEALTGYMPAEFRTFWKLIPATGKLESLDDGPGEQKYPVVFSTDDGAYAMGIYSPDQPSAGFEGAGYGRFRFPAEKVVKWNCVFRVRDPAGIKPGDYAYRMLVAVGTLEDVRENLVMLVAEQVEK